MAVVRTLKSMIYERFDSEVDFAKHIGWPRQKLNKITNGKKEPDLLEVKVLADGLSVDFNEIAFIFLSMRSPNG